MTSDMNPVYDALPQSGLEYLWEDGERVFWREWRADERGSRTAVLGTGFIAPHPTPHSLERLAHEFALKDELDGEWALRPLALERKHGRTILLLEDAAGEPLDRLIVGPMEVGRFLRLAIGITTVLGKAHARGLIHKDIKPTTILVNQTTGDIKLTGFGFASRLVRERQAPDPPEFIAGTLAYMAPEQTGRMNRSLDSRTDLYALGVTLYQMLTGALPFAAMDPIDWIHCHLAMKAVPPHERRADVPIPACNIVMKLLAKTPEDRYQTAAGLERDLRRCLAEWEMHRAIDDFSLGAQDTSDRFLIPEKLYGRAREVERLLASFDRVITNGVPELVLVSGYSGIGKSSVVNELHKMLVPSRGLFASGKFDQYRRDVPYSTLVQAFQGLVRTLLGKSDAALDAWRRAILEALGPNGRLMVDLVPELKLIIGEQPPATELPPQQAKNRFQLVFRQFVAVFAQPEHPLALFFDDLQWLDAATLELLQHILTGSDLSHLLLIGAYRDNEIDGSHPLMRTLQAMESAGVRIEKIELVPLARDDLEQLVVDALRSQSESARPLAQVLHQKTAGNPFFAIQFLNALAEEQLLAHEHTAARWCWDLDRIHAKGYTDNVADLMAAKMTRLPTESREVLQHVACIGNSATLAMLSAVLGRSEERVDAELWEAVRQELVQRSGGAYKFVHDRVQEAAYSLIPEAFRAAVHLRIGRMLVAHTPPERRQDAIFEIVNQLNRGAALIASGAEREQLAELNSVAGNRAKASSAYVTALTYFETAAAMLPADRWERRRELSFEVEVQRAECEFLTGALAFAEERLAALSLRAASALERARVASLSIDLMMTLGQNSRAVAVGLDFLQHLGIEWPLHPTKDDVRPEYDRIWSQLGGRRIEQLIDLPLMTNPVSWATLEVLIKLGSPALFTDLNLFTLVICCAVNLSLEHGNSEASAPAYVQLGTLAGSRFGDYAAAFQFGRIGYELIERRGFKRFQASTYATFGNMGIPSARHVREGREILRRAFDAANAIGDLPFAAFSCTQIVSNMLMAGDPLLEMQREAEYGLAFAQKHRFGLVVDTIATQLGLIRTLRGLTPTFGRFDHDRFDERQIESRFSENPNLAYAEYWYYVRKLQARFFAGDYSAALEAASRMEKAPWIERGGLEAADYHFYAALSRAGGSGSWSAGERQDNLDSLGAHHRQLQIWADNCLENFENRAALVAAELARLEGRDLDAMRLYEQAIRSARSQGFVHNEALAYELAARFYAARGFDEVSHLYLQNARAGYYRWGAEGKMKQLAGLYPYLSTEKRMSGVTGTIGTPVEHLDLATVIQVSQDVSSEIVPEKLLVKIMRTALAQAGAERGLLILPRGDEMWIVAEAAARSDTAVVELCNLRVTEAALPESVLHFVLRSRESVILNDAAADSSFAADTYVTRRDARSILCVPLLTGANLVGALYLENNLAPGVFALNRAPVLKLLASQAAISLENTRLYRDLEEREAKIRRLVDANIIGIFIWQRGGQILDANDAFLRVVGYDREALVAGRLHWTDLTPPEFRGRDAQAIEELNATGTIQPYEKEYFRKNGGRVPVLIGAATFEEGNNQGVAFVLDLTEAKRATDALQEVQAELAHTNRLAAMGQLTASIAHEVNQPIGAMVTNAQAGLRFLDAKTPDLEEVREALASIVEGGHRAADVVSRIRAFVKKAPARMERFDMNEAIREVIVVTRGEAAKNEVSVEARLAEGLPLIDGDRIQLQQVVLNLIINAIEAMSGIDDEPRDLLIKTARSGSDSVSVAVQDSGTGLDPANADRAFEAFYTTKPQGLGIGLSICRSIVEAHGGVLAATTATPRGAVFQFIVPAIQATKP